MILSVGGGQARPDYFPAAIVAVIRPASSQPATGCRTDPTVRLHRDGRTDFTGGRTDYSLPGGWTDNQVHVGWTDSLLGVGGITLCCLGGLTVILLPAEAGQITES